MNDRPNESALEQRINQLVKYMSVGILCLLLVGIMSGITYHKVMQEKEVAQTNSQVQAETTKESSFCSIYPDDEVCKMARSIAANPTQTVIPKDGVDGQDGRGVTTFDVSNEGNLIVNFTDGTSKDVGHIIGKDGIDGINGTDGRGILSVTIDAGNLIIGFSDGTSENLGMVVGPAGADGKDGAAGKDGESITGPQGPQGEPGAPGAAGKDGVSMIDLQVDSAGFVNVYYSDGSIRPAGQVIVNTVRAISCQNDTFTMTMVDGKTLSTVVDCTPEKIPDVLPPNPIKVP